MSTVDDSEWTAHGALALIDAIEQALKRNGVKIRSKSGKAAFLCCGQALWCLVQVDRVSPALKTVVQLLKDFQLADAASVAWHDTAELVWRDEFPTVRVVPFGKWYAEFCEVLKLTKSDAALEKELRRWLEKESNPPTP
ncbi:MAG TPA: hypothetical protein VH595_01320 [Verrucomicrobiae bacterium]|nr:hypothetical protein [Verrucomicrobiae bacterium]